MGTGMIPCRRLGAMPAGRVAAAQKTRRQLLVCITLHIMINKQPEAMQQAAHAQNHHGSFNASH
jgi:hypothetical protein